MLMTVTLSQKWKRQRARSMRKQKKIMTSKNLLVNEEKTEYTRIKEDQKKRKENGEM